MYNQKKSAGVRVPECPFDAMQILDKELIPHLRLNPESWDLVGEYMEAMKKKFSPEELRKYGILF